MNTLNTTYMAEVEIVIMVMLILIAIGLIPQIFYLLTLSKAIRLCAPHNRRMEPGQVWMIFIPIYGIVWRFMMIGHIADTLAEEFRQRNIPCNEPRPGYNLGLTYAILMLCGVIPFLGGLAALGGLVCWIMYWVKIADYIKLLEQSNMMYNTQAQGGWPQQQYYPNQNQQQQQQYYPNPNQQQNQGPNIYPNHPDQKPPTV